MSADRLREAARVEREEWGGEVNARAYPKAAAIHLALADWLDAEARSLIAFGEAERNDTHAHRVADAILGGQS